MLVIFSLNFNIKISSSEVQKAVSSIQELHRRWQDLLNNANPTGKEELNWTTSEIKNSIRSVEWDLEDLEETIGIVETNPGKFTLPKDEIDNRKGFIQNVKRTVQSIKEEVHSSETRVKIEKNNRQVRDKIIVFDLRYLVATACARKQLACEWKRYSFLEIIYGVANLMRAYSTH